MDRNDDDAVATRDEPIINDPGQRDWLTEWLGDANPFRAANPYADRGVYIGKPECGGGNE